MKLLIRSAGLRGAAEDVRNDVTYALRTFRGSPTFFVAAVASLALGIGATTALFSVVDRLFLQAPAGVVDAGSLRHISIKRDSGGLQTPSGGPGLWSDYVAMRDGVKGFNGIAAYLSPVLVDLGRGRDATQLRAGVASHDFLAVLGVRPALGRFFTSDEDRGAAPVAIIGYAIWQSRFGGVSDVIGKTLLLNGQVLEIIGVTARGFGGISMDPVDVWLPSSAAESLAIVSNKEWRKTLLGTRYVARLARGVGELDAARDAAIVLKGEAQSDTALDQTPEVLAEAFLLAGAPGLRQVSHLSLWVGIVAAIVLVIACANVVNLLLGRAVSRRRELALRLSLGASPGRIVRQHLTESVVLALLGGLAGLLLAHWMIGMMQRFPVGPATSGVDARLFLFALFVSLLSSTVFGALPAVSAAQVLPAEALKANRPAGTRGHKRTRRIVVAVQVSLSVVLVIAASLFVRSLQQINAIRTGVDLEHLLVATVDLRRAGYATEARSELFNSAVSRVSAVPGVKRASVAHFPPLSGLGLPVPWRVPGRESEQKKAAFLNLVGPEYFETAGMRLLQGRTIVRTDNGTSEPIAVVNETLAQLMAADGNVVGLCVPFQRQIKAGGCTSIVGVVEARRHRYLDDEAVPLVFRPWAQAPTGIPFGIPVVLIQTYGDPAEHAAAVRGALQGLRDDLPYVTVRPLTDILRSKVQPFQLGATVFSVFGILSLALAAIGLYGVLGSFVSELIAEIGVRRAVGAPARAIVGLVVRQSLVPLGAGLILGMLLALAGTRYLASLLFGIEPWDPFSFTAAAVCLTCVALLAAFIPAWRAAHVDALIALRHE